MKKIILILTFVFIHNITTFAEWDLKITRQVTGKTSIRLLTIPFEGLNRYTTNPDGNNRVCQIFAGSVHRRYLNQNSFVEKPIIYLTSNNTSVFLASCFAEVVSNKDVYGFGKYLIEFENYNNPSKNINFIFNTLDSKAGMDNLINGRPYHSDWSISYIETSNSAFVIIDNGDTSSYRYIDTVFLGQSNREINYWYAYWRSSVPLAKNFYARTTPFPMNPYLIDENNKLSNIRIGTKVIFDTVYHNFGYTDRYGYNTVETNGPYDYFNQTPIPDFNPNQKGNIFTTPAYFCYYTPSEVTWGIKIIAENTDTIILKKDKLLYVNGLSSFEGGDTLLLKQGSSLIKEEGAGLNACNRGIIIDEGCNSVWSANSKQRIYENSRLIYTGTSHLINNGGSVQVDAYAILKIGDNTTLTFSGQNTYLELKPNSVVKLGENAKIEFKDGAYLIADHSAISALDESKPATGLYFENASGLTSITNCSFANCHIPIDIKNNQSNASSNKVITNNTFTLTGSSNDRCILAENIFSLNASNNTFNLGTSGIGIYIKNFYNSSNSIGDGNNNAYSLNILHNTFNNGSISLILASYASALTPYTIDNVNSFNGNSYISILGRMMSGSIKNNNVNSSLARAFHFYNSNPDLYNNTVTSSKNLLSGSMSAVNLSPIKTTEGLVWQAGFNNMTANGQDNIEYNFGNINLDEGRNLFIRSGSCYHLYGIMNTYDNIYYAKNNCFNNSNNPVAYLLNLNSEVINVISQPSTYDCSIYPLTPISWIVRDIGYGQYDSIKVTAAPSGSQLTDADLLLSQASVNYNTGNYFDAVNNYKTLINNYPENENLVDCLYNLYACHEQIDTLGTQASKDILYGNLLAYLNDKISSGLYSNDFNDVAYNLSLNCSAQIQDFYAACDGFEFLSLYHPNPDARLLASWDYAEVQALLGTGGSISSKEEKMSTEEFLKYRIKRMNNLIKGDPIKKKMKETYSKTSNKRDENNSKKFANLPKEDAKKKIQSLKSEENKLINKAINNLKTVKTLSSAEKNKKQLEDLLLTAGITDLNGKTQVTNNVIPQNYELLQNYPNPFNPVTNIKFQIPKDGFVSLKVYDITGREITKLVNEVKQAGSYTVTFNGSNFASGVYFYRIQIGDFVQVKKMMLIK
jgi:hypothetical protein